MDSIALTLNATAKDQVMTIDVEPNGHRMTVRFQLKYLEYVQKYAISLWDAATGDPIVTNVPVVASYDLIANDLFRQVFYKGIGSMWCGPVVEHPTTVDPTLGTLNEYELIWGDTTWTN